MSFFLDALRMIRDIRRTSRAIDVWGASLNVPQLIGGVIFITAVEGQAVLVSLVFTLVVAGQIHKKSPFSRLIGLCHIPWLGLLPWLIYRLQLMEGLSPLKVWGCYVILTIAISLVFDVIDVYRYFKGKRKFAWSE